MNSTDSTDHPGVIAWPPLIFLGCAVGGSLLQFIFPIRVMRHSVSLSLGVVLAVVSTSLAIWAERVMKAAGTNVRPDRPALTIVRSGPYRFTRNPMYLSLCLLQLALGFVLDGWIPLLFTIPLMLILHFGVILREERYLEGKFGEQYLAFKREVRRWI
jgi:protein-S-isoprenylcysteine O-methyltransferase Ste14